MRAGVCAPGAELPGGGVLVAFVCRVCGAEFDGSPRLTRFLAGSAGDAESPGLCWVCNRLYQSVAREAAAYAAASCGVLFCP